MKLRAATFEKPTPIYTKTMLMALHKGINFKFQALLTTKNTETELQLRAK